MSARAPVLVERVVTACPTAEGSPPLFVARFDAAGFDASRFAAAGIACPASVARSVRKRQAEFFHGRLAARAAMQAQGACAADLPVGPGGEPMWPAALVGSVSHTEGIAAAVAGPRACHRGLGLDIEHVASPERARALRAVALDAAEAEVLASNAGTLSLDLLATLAFSAKESLYKGAFPTVRRFFGFRAARVEAIDRSRGTLTLVLREDLHAEYPRGRRCEVRSGRLGGTTVWTLFDAGTPD